MHDSPRMSTSTGHWARFRRLMVVVGGVAVIAIGAALALLHRDGVVLRPHFVVAVALGIGVSLLLAGALMGLVFVSASSGHDTEVERFTERRNEQGRPGRRPWQ